MKQPRILSLYRDQENSKKDRPNLDNLNKISVIKEEKLYKTKNKTRPKYIYSENNTYSFKRPKSSKKPLYTKPNKRPILTNNK